MFDELFPSYLEIAMIFAYTSFGLLSLTLTISLLYLLTHKIFTDKP